MNASSPVRAAVALLGAQLALQLAWHAWLAPSSRAALALSALPLVPGLWLALYDMRRGALLGAIASLLYFAHGATELMQPGAPRVLAVAEIGVTLAIIAALCATARGAPHRARASAKRSRD